MGLFFVPLLIMSKLAERLCTVSAKVMRISEAFLTQRRKKMSCTRVRFVYFSGYIHAVLMAGWRYLQRRGPAWLLNLSHCGDTKPSMRRDVPCEERQFERENRYEIVWAGNQASRRWRCADSVDVGEPRAVRSFR